MYKTLAFSAISGLLALGAFAPMAAARSSGYGGGGGGGGGGFGCLPAFAWSPTANRCVPLGILNNPALNGNLPPGLVNNPGRGGRVLGAQSLNLTGDVHLRMSGADVSSLQQFLIDAGFNIPSGVTGYFGGETLAAVIAYQKAHGITPAAGFVGALTRASFANGTGQLPAVQSNNLTAGQKNSILQLLTSFNADPSVIANVKASLGI